MCGYCGQEWVERKGACSCCGAPNKLAKLEKGGPYFYEPYIYYVVREGARAGTSFVFYLGTTFVQSVFISREEMESWPPYEDCLYRIVERIVK